ncbi:hypothetical protein [Massilia varians]|uniref:hypothetical protein n=1 Tax=Massilia varians TaxID=457921 RepID=UPI002554F7FC|nr:hypothetical protein [Massilia varians]MDK6079643.1 hypothetical protein [Massilia varians]
MNDLAILEEDEPAASTHGSADDPDGRAVMIRTVTKLCTLVREKIRMAEMQQFRCALRIGLCDFPT